MLMAPSWLDGLTRSLAAKVTAEVRFLYGPPPLVGISTIDGSLPPLPLLSRRVLPLGDAASVCGWAIADWVSLQ